MPSLCWSMAIQGSCSQLDDSSCRVLLPSLCPDRWDMRTTVLNLQVVLPTPMCWRDRKPPIHRHQAQSPHSKDLQWMIHLSSIANDICSHQELYSFRHHSWAGTWTHQVQIPDHLLYTMERLSLSDGSRDSLFLADLQWVPLLVFQRVAPGPQMRLQVEIHSHRCSIHLSWRQPWSCCPVHLLARMNCSHHSNIWERCLLWRWSWSIHFHLWLGWKVWLCQQSPHLHSCWGIQSWLPDPEQEFHHRVSACKLLLCSHPHQAQWSSQLSTKSDHRSHTPVSRTWCWHFLSQRHLQRRLWRLRFLPLLISQRKRPDHCNQCSNQKAELYNRNLACLIQVWQTCSPRADCLNPWQLPWLWHSLHRSEQYPCRQKLMSYQDLEFLLSSLQTVRRMCCLRLRSSNQGLCMQQQLCWMWRDLSLRCRNPVPSHHCL